MALDSIVSDVNGDFSNEEYLSTFVELTHHLHEPEGRNKARAYYDALPLDVRTYIRNSKSGWLVQCVYFSC